MPRPWLASVRRLLVCLLLVTATLSANSDAVVGVPYTFDLSGGAGLESIPSIPEFEFTYAFTLAGGTLPPGLALKSNGLLSGTPTTAGQYDFSIRWVFK